MLTNILRQKIIQDGLVEDAIKAIPIKIEQISAVRRKVLNENHPLKEAMKDG